MTEQRYEIIKLLGQGRTGGVYEAEDSTLGRKVALRRFFAESEEINLDGFKEDFEEFSQSLSVLQHPNLLRIYDAGVDGEGAYIISQLLNGVNLLDKIKGGPMPVCEVYDLGQQMLDALSTAHQEGYVHGAITPGSILLTPRARGGYLYVILDMGLSKLAPLIQGKDSILSIMADPAILAPELFGGAAADVKADLYMLGQILYMCLAGGHPFGGVSAEEAEKMHKQGLPPIQQYVPDIPEDFRMWLGKLVQIQPYHRPASAVEALNSLPKVPGQVRTQSEAVYTATGRVHLNIATATQLQMPAISLTGPQSAYEISPTSEAGTIPVFPQSSKKVLCISLAALFAVVAITTISMLFGGDTQDEIPISKVMNDVVNTDDFYSMLNVEKVEKVEDSEDSDKIIITHFDVAKFKVAVGWEYAFRGQQGMTIDGWEIIHTNTRVIPGLKFPLKNYENAMLDLGWKLTYIVRPVKGIHRVGFHFDEKLNPGWEGDSVLLYLTLENTANGEVKLSSIGANNKAKNGKSVTVPYIGKEGWHTITVEQNPATESGAYTVTIDGQLAFRDTFTHGKSFITVKDKFKKGKNSNTWDNHLFTLSYERDREDTWVIKELKLETL